MEKLAALCCLWANGLGAKEDYMAELDRLFLENPEDDFLLELENLNGDKRDRSAAWKMLCPLVENSPNTDKFCKELLAALETVYNENRLPPVVFGERSLHMLYELPHEMTAKEPFHSLFFADIPYDEYYDEERTREIYQKAFVHYRTDSQGEDK